MLLLLAKSRNLIERNIVYFFVTSLLLIDYHFVYIKI